MGYKNDAQRKAAHASMAEQSPAKQMGIVIYFYLYLRYI